MRAEERKAYILQKLQKSDVPVSASAFAAELSVSRQVVVGDVALLRASGEQIRSTPRGYVCTASQEAGMVSTIACVHTPGQTAEELETIVYYGGEVLDVIVAHPVYGQISAPLEIRTNYDVELFIQAIQSKEAVLLSDLTGGLHLHTVRCAGEQTFARICRALEEKGILYHGQE